MGFNPFVHNLKFAGKKVLVKAHTFSVTDNDNVLAESTLFPFSELIKIIFGRLHSVLDEIQLPSKMCYQFYR